MVRHPRTPSCALCSHSFLRRTKTAVARSAMANENAVQVVEEKQDLGWLGWFGLSRSPLDLHIQYGIYVYIYIYYVCIYIILYYMILYYIILYYIIVYSILVYSIILYCILFYYIILYSILFYSIILYYIVLILYYII